MNPCSTIAVRRYQAGELSPEERAALQAHFVGCARCARTRLELEEERQRLREDVPFEVFAAGVAEKLARPARSRWTARRLVGPLALAASVLLVAGVALRSGLQEDTTRTKGGATFEVFVDEAAAVRKLEPGEKIARGARLLPALHGAQGKRMVVTLIEPGESSVVYDGPLREGPLPRAFEWTGTGSATLRVAVDGETIAEVALRR